MALAPRGWLAACLISVLLALPSIPAGAQEEGKVRIQTIPLNPDKGALAAPIVHDDIDYRELMRKFVQDISSFARKHRRDFTVIAQNGAELLGKPMPRAADEEAEVDEDTPPPLAPARTYMRAIDGILQEALLFGGPNIEAPQFDKPTSNKRRKHLLRFTELAKANGLKVLVMDYGKDRGTIRRSFRGNAKRGYVSFTAHAAAAGLASMPSFARWPYNENPKSVISLKSVRNFLYLRNSAPLGRQDEFAMRLHNTNFDAVIVDVFHGRQPLSKQAVETLKYKKLGARRMVLAYMNIGRAAGYLYYWKPEWREGSPSWIGAPVSSDPDSHVVEFWRAGWQKIITGDTNSYIYGIVAQGFDGVVLGGLESFRAFEGSRETADATQ